MTSKEEIESRTTYQVQSRFVGMDFHAWKIRYETPLREDAEWMARYYKLIKGHQSRVLTIAL